MRIAIFSWESLYAIKIGGVGIHVFNLARSLQHLGNEVHIFTRQGEKLSLKDTVEGIYIHRLPCNHGDNFFNEVKSFNNTLVYYYTEISSNVGNFDILHCHDWLTFDAGLRLKDEVKLVATFHTTELGRSGQWPETSIAKEISSLENSMVCNCKRLIAISYEVRRELELLYKIPDWKTEVIYNGIDIEKARYTSQTPSTIRSELNISKASKIILYIGSFSYKKGTDILLSTCSKVLNNCNDAVYVFFGRGEMNGRVEATCRDHPNRIIALDSKEQVKLQQLYKEAYIVATPFRSDPFAAITLTAWAASKPVISLDRGASSEIIYNDVNGIISSEEALAENIVKLLQNPEHVKWLGNNAKVTVETAFTWEEVAKSTEKLYKKTK